jgi:hypothetical protein
MWEYRYRHLLRHNPALRTFVANKRSTTPQRKMSEKELLREVTTDRLFGMLEGLHRHVTCRSERVKKSCVNHNFSLKIIQESTTPMASLG